ncbi:TonB-dependent receptor [Pedobacter caeni]|nr:TonB-dependent receptor [Pedobacter caeni]
MVFLVLMAGGMVKAQNIPLRKKMTVRFSNVTLEEALNLLNADHTTPLSFDPSIIPEGKRFNRSFSDAPLSLILEFLLAETGLSYKFLFREVIILPMEQNKTTLNGRIVDAETGEDLIGASMYIESLKQGVNSNNYGFYSLTVPTSDYEILVSHVGYVSQRLNFSLQFPNYLQIIRLQKQVNKLEEIVVKAVSAKDSIAPKNPGQALDWETLRNAPYYRGEADVIKALQMQNGILALTEGSSQMFIRGGNKDQNLILLDEAIVYNPSHLFGLSSVFNPDALKNVQTYTDAMPANFGGRLSSVIDARMADGDDKNFHVKGGLSLLAARVSLEGPLVKEKGSFLFAARRSLSNVLRRDLELFDLKPAYHDFNFKVNHRFNSRDRLFFSSYIGRDKVRSQNGYFNRWGNQTATLRWNHIFTPRLFLNLSAIYSNYKNELYINADSPTGMDKWITGIKDATVKGDFIFYHKPQSQFQFGFSSILHLFIPGEINKEEKNSIPRARAAESAIYASHRWLIGEKVRLSYGLRMSMFQNISTPRLFNIDEFYEPVDFETDVRGGYKRFFRLEPRFTFQYMLRPSSYLQLNYNRNYQYLQLLQNDELAFSSLESWIPSSPNLAPQQSDLFSMEYKGRFPFGILSLSGYYKKMNNQLELVDHAQLISNPAVETQLRPGSSEAYGLEFMLSKDIGRFKGTFFYTWSRVFRTIDQINQGKRYPANYDIPHVAKLALGYRISDQLSVHSLFTYNNGRPVTFPIGYFLQKDVKVPIYGERNSARMPDFHRLDLNLKWEPSTGSIKKRQFISSFNVGLYNVYGRKNPLVYRINQNNPEDLQFDEQIFSGRTFAFSYNFKF